MARLVKRGSKQNIISALWDGYNSLDVFTRMFLVIAIAIAIVTPYVVANPQILTQEAAKGGSGGGGGSGGHGGKPGNFTATVTVSPNPVPVNSQFQITGCGYRPLSGVQINIYQPYGTSVQGDTVDSNGCLTVTSGWADGTAGSARVDVFQDSKTLVARTAFTIQ